MSTPDEIMERAHALEDEGYEEIPIFRLLGHTWIENEGLRAALRQLKRAGLIRASETPGFLVLG